MVTSAGTTTYFHANKQGSIIAMSGAGAARTEGPYTYDPYGNCFLGATATSCNASGEPYRFTGRRRDPELGAYYYRARYYSSGIGRFLQTDPVGYDADLNLYSYVHNDPADAVDPSGMDVVYYTQGLSGYYVMGGEGSMGVILDLEALRAGKLSATSFYTAGFGGGGGEAEGAYGGAGSGVGYFAGSPADFHGQFVSGTLSAKQIGGVSVSVAFPPNHMFDPKYGNVNVQGGLGVAGGSGAITYTWFGANKSVDLNRMLGAVNTGLNALSRFSGIGSRILGNKIDQAKKKLESARDAITRYQQQNHQSSSQQGPCSPSKGGCGPGGGVEDTWGR